ncbi:hypothetical protein K8I28_17325 [bacterium]|nr:hypothetical protein [bacterium]
MPYRHFFTRSRILSILLMAISLITVPNNSSGQDSLNISKVGELYDFYEVAQAAEIVGETVLVMFSRHGPTTIQAFHIEGDSLARTEMVDPYLPSYVFRDTMGIDRNWILDLSNPLDSVRVGDLGNPIDRGRFGGYQVIDNYLYLIEQISYYEGREREKYLRIYDISRPEFPVLVHRSLLERVSYEQNYNTALSIGDNFMIYNGERIYDLSNPVDPVFIGNWDVQHQEYWSKPIHAFQIVYTGMKAKRIIGVPDLLSQTFPILQIRCESTKMKVTVF